MSRFSGVRRFVAGAAAVALLTAGVVAVGVAPASAVVVSPQTFTTPGDYTFTVPDGVTVVRITAVGAGGATHVEQQCFNIGFGSFCAPFPYAGGKGRSITTYQQVQAQDQLSVHVAAVSQSATTVAGGRVSVSAPNGGDAYRPGLCPPFCNWAYGSDAGEATVSPSAPGYPADVSALVSNMDSSGSVAIGWAKSITVTSASDSGAGSLREAITAANDTGNLDATLPDVITFDPSVTDPIVLASDLPAITGAVNIVGPGARVLTVSGDDKFRPFSFAAGSTVRLSGLGIAHGHGGEQFAPSGGNVQVAQGATAFIDGVSLTGGSAHDGGGVTTSGDLTLTNSVVSGNSASQWGGGVMVVKYPSAPAPAVTIVNSTITGNSGRYSGGGVMTQGGGVVTVTASTIAGNSGNDGYGGGVLTYNGGSLSLRSTVLLANYAATGGTCGTLYGGSVTDSGYNVSSDSANSGVYNSCGLSTDNHSVFDADGSPVDVNLGPLQNNGGPTDTLMPLGDSPILDVIPPEFCTDLGGSPAAITTDQRGQSRPQGAGCEIGAVEVPAITVTPDAKSVAYNDSAPAYTFTLSPLTPSTNYTAPTCSAPGYTVGAATGSTFTISCAGGKADGYSFVQTATADLYVTKATPTVAISNTPTSPVVGDSFTPTLTTSSDGATSVTSSDTNVCTVNAGTGVVSFIATGTCTLVAHVAASANWSAVDGQAQQVSVAKASTSVSISNLPASAVVGDSFTPTLTTTSDGTKSVTSSDTSVCTVNLVTGVVSFIATGTCTLVAHVASSATYEMADGADQQVSVAKASTSVSISNLPASAVVGGSFTPTLTTSSDGVKSVTSSTTGVCTVNVGTGAVSFIATGSCTLVAHVASSTIWAAAVGQAQQVTVSAVVPSVARSVAGSPRNKSVLVSWVAPSSTGGAAIKEYKVTASPKVGSVFKSCTVSGSARSCTVVGLTNGKPYTFTVRATNTGGKSSTTAASAAVIAGTATAPRSLVVSTSVAHKAKVRWTAPQYIGSGAVIGYQVRWCTVGGSCSVWSTLPASPRSASVTGRVKGTKYRVEIQAKNASGYGPVTRKAFTQAH